MSLKELAAIAEWVGSKRAQWSAPWQDMLESDNK